MKREQFEWSYGIIHNEHTPTIISPLLLEERKGGGEHTWLRPGVLKHRQLSLQRLALVCRPAHPPAEERNGRFERFTRLHTIVEDEDSLVWAGTSGEAFEVLD
jgi:hypothetical protein